VEISVSGPSLKDDGTLCDIGMLQKIVDDVVTPLHYRDLDALEAFQGQNTTAERLAIYLHESLAPRLETAALASLAVQVWESPQAFASYEDALRPSSS